MFLEFSTPTSRTPSTSVDCESFTPALPLCGTSAGRSEKTLPPFNQAWYLNLSISSTSFTWISGRPPLRSSVSPSTFGVCWRLCVRVCGQLIVGGAGFKPRVVLTEVTVSLFWGRFLIGHCRTAIHPTTILSLFLLCLGLCTCSFYLFNSQVLSMFPWSLSSLHPAASDFSATVCLKFLRILLIFTSRGRIEACII